MNKYTASKNIAVIAIIAALLVISKLMLSFVPNVEIITPLIIIFTCVFGFKRMIFAVFIFCLLDNLLYSFSYLVTLQYFFHWPLLCILSSVTFKLFKDNIFVFALLSVIMAILFWIETPVIMTIFKVSKFYLLLKAGVIFMIPMAIGGFIFTFLGFRPLYSILIKINKKMLI